MRSELETWQIIDQYFDTFFGENRINTLCDLAIFLSFDKIGVLLRTERDVILKRLKRAHRKRNIEKHSPIWASGEVEPRKEFIKQIIKFLEDEQRKFEKSE